MCSQLAVHSVHDCTVSGYCSKHTDRPIGCEGALDIASIMLIALIDS
jgi:hypothetical protein